MNTRYHRTFLSGVVIVGVSLAMAVAGCASSTSAGGTSAAAPTGASASSPGGSTPASGASAGDSAAASSASGDSGAADANHSPVTLNFGWWGNDKRTAITMNVIKAFEKQYPYITIQPQHADFDSYFAKLATQAAGKSQPDVMQMDESYIKTYGERGALLDLQSLKDPALDLSKFSKATIDEGMVDGKLRGISVGDNTMAIIVNPNLFKEAGVAMPDDKTWTWDDMAADGEAIAKALKGKAYGIQPMDMDYDMLQNYARQHGESIFTDDGKVGISVATVTDWYNYWLKLRADGVVPPESSVVENMANGISGSFIATNKAAIAYGSTNELTALAAASGAPLKLLQLPAIPNAKSGWAYFKPSQYWSASAYTKHPAEVALFLNFLCNSKTAADYLLTERAVPANQEIREYIEPKLSPSDEDQVAFLKEMASVVGAPSTLMPPGAADATNFITSVAQNVMFKKETPAQGATDLINSMSTTLANAG